MKIFFIAAFIAFFVPVIVQAESVLIKVDTQGSAINAIEGVIHINPGISDIEIKDGGSDILIWIDPPTYDPVTGEVVFSGITPGGFRGIGQLFLLESLSLVGTGRVTFSDIRALSNDGEALNVPVRLYIAPGETVDDSTPPESFKPIISRSETVFEGRYFASFLTHDKASGLKKYEYAYKLLGRPNEDEWKTAVSPLELKDEALWRKVYIRAVDHQGNERVVSVPGPYYYMHLGLWAIIILSFIWVLFYTRRFQSLR